MKKYNSLLIYLGILLLVFLPIFWFSGSFALYTTDSGAYLLNARELKVPGDRSIFYSVLIFLITEMQHFVGSSEIVWLVMFQMILTYVLIIQFVRTFFSGINVNFFLLIFLFLTPVSWMCIQVMPDIFSVTLFLSGLLFLNSTKKWISILYGSIVFLSLVVHNSNVLLFLVFSGGIFLGRNHLAGLKFWKPRFLQLLMVSIFAISSIFATNVYANRELSLGVSSEVFFIGKLCENGILKKYLNKYCNQEPNPLCAYKDKLPEHSWDFIWEENGAFANSGGWYESDSLYKKIIRRTLTDPDLLKWHVIEAGKATAKQITLIGAGDGIVKLDTNATVVNELKLMYPTDYKMLVNGSAQQQEKIPFSDFNLIYMWFGWISILAALFFVFINKQYQQLWMFILASYFAICNAFITGAMANVITRLNTKGITTLIAVSILIIMSQLNPKTKFFRG